MKKLLSLASLLAAAAAGCGETTTVPPSQLNLDRPTDIAFACYGGMRVTNGGAATAQQDVVVSAMPTYSCEVRSEKFDSTKEDQHTPPGQEPVAGGELLGAVNWYGFVLQSGPGTVAVVNFPTKPAESLGDIDLKVLDANALTPGKNAISVGEDPVAIVTDRAGCHAITANAGSCDLSVLDVTSALDTDPAVKVDRLAVKNASGTPIRAKPAAMVTEPSILEVGNMCPATPTGLVYIAYPSCHLVAGVDTATGTIVTGVQYDAAGVPSIVGGNVTCPDECSGDPATPGIRPVTLDLELDPRTATRRLVIGAENSRSIAIVELDDASKPLSLFQVALEDPAGDLGVTALALSPEIGMGGNGQMINDEGPGGQFQFVYAVATDHTVRVADVLNVRAECDTQVDPRLVRDIRMVRRLSCFPVGDPMTPARRAGAVGPGIRVPGVPYSVAFLRAEKACPANVTECDRDPRRLVGYFATVSTSLGATFVVNVDDDNYPDVFNTEIPVDVPMGLALPHRVRDAVAQRSARVEGMSADGPSCDYTGPSPDADGIPQGGPRALTVPARTVPAGSVATEKLTQLPGFRQLECVRTDEAGTVTTRKAVTELAFTAPDAVRDREFPDLDALTAEETWSLAWEGSLSANKGDTDVGGPAVRESMLFVDGAGMHLRDQTKPYCDAGVEPFDIVQLRGCDPAAGSADCPSGYTCFVHPDSQVAGLGACMRSDEADRLANACKDFLTTARRYTVKTAASGELLLMPRRFELRTTPLDGCVDDDQCQTLADYALRSGRAAHPKDIDNSDPNTHDQHKWGCVVDPLRAPMGGTGKRCEMRCSANSDCLAGTVCAGAVAGQAFSGFCMESVTPPQSCVNAPQRYELRAGEAFTVLGSRSGFVHPIIADANGKCIKDPAASPLSIGRIPLEPKDRLAPSSLHPCDPTADPFTGKLPNGTYEPNPCSTTVAHTEAKPNYTPGTCTLDQGNPSSIVERQAPAVRFRNRGMTWTIVDPYYPGDSTCISDRMGNLGKIPHVVPGYVLSFRQTAGFSPKPLPSRATFPTKVVRGPLQTTWVMDQGDFLSSSSTAASTRGSVFVYDALRIVQILQ